MNVYDFDGTVYDGDSSVDFWVFCAKKRPRILLRLPAFALAFAKNRLGIIPKTRLKEAFFSFLKTMPADDALLEEFWAEHFSKVKAFYLETKKPDDVVISASPEFLLEPACALLGILPPIASRVDPGTGRFDGSNCRGEEKVARFEDAFPGASIDEFFSDSDADAPLAGLAKRAWRVDGTKVAPWPW